ncbi:uncharacterized protein BCR38DRAFT_491413 [Pseudomassariella vexata]|uniref:Uncharacterized protein n=1 Tax=Pseudomassariella vexata TaxID=1141098 RepID=A0A1Y2D7W1_9PEZI|nr:uncharacterized protein BCR38DRAFT_491413 [Pseudomassariella vexata]ORY54725.1 hypothetical protein BCR38DRAFT_491413 [Pseudomassariella vexata]
MICLTTLLITVMAMAVMGTPLVALPNKDEVLTMDTSSFNQASDGMPTSISGVLAMIKAQDPDLFPNILHVISRDVGTAKEHALTPRHNDQGGVGPPPPNKCCPKGYPYKGTKKQKNNFWNMHLSEVRSKQKTLHKVQKADQADHRNEIQKLRQKQFGASSKNKAKYRTAKNGAIAKYHKEKIEDKKLKDGWQKHKVFDKKLQQQDKAGGIKSGGGSKGGGRKGGIKSVGGSKGGGRKGGGKKAGGKKRH